MLRGVTLERIETARAHLTQAACIVKGNYGAKELSQDEQRWVREMLQAAVAAIDAAGGQG
jgi:hypothetical protein